MLYRLYIGSNNKTKKLESKKAIRLVSKEYKGFTSFKGLGYWNGRSEKTLIIEIEAQEKRGVLSLCKRLAKDLEQEAIGLASIGKMQFIEL
jgi:hypothetical protein